MTDRYTRDELLGFERDFEEDLPEEGEGAQGASTTTNPPPAGALRADQRHDFKPSPNPRNDGCAACGRSKTNPIHEQHPELRKAAVVSAFDMAVKAMREGDDDMARVHGGLAMRLLEGKT